MTAIDQFNRTVARAQDGDSKALASLPDAAREVFVESRELYKSVVPPEEGHLELVRRKIEESYFGHPTGCGGSFGEILCHEIHTRGLTFGWLAEKWGVSLPTLGELIWDHCKRLEPLPEVQHESNENPA